MKKVIYTCNLCNTECTRIELLAMWADQQSFLFFEANNLRFDETDRHICKNCVKLIKEKAP